MKHYKENCKYPARNTKGRWDHAASKRILLLKIAWREVRGIPTPEKNAHIDHSCKSKASWSAQPHFSHNHTQNTNSFPAVPQIWLCIYTDKHPVPPAAGGGAFGWEPRGNFLREEGIPEKYGFCNTGKKLFPAATSKAKSRSHISKVYSGNIYHRKTGTWFLLLLTEVTSVDLLPWAHAVRWWKLPQPPL